MPLQKINYTQIRGGVANVLDFGADSTGATDCSAAYVAAMAAASKIYFPSGTYLFNSTSLVTKNNVEIDFGNATIVHGNFTGTIFQFSAAADTPSNTGLKITGGYFTQSDATTSVTKNYIVVGAVKDFSISKCNLKNVSNGGICVLSGAADGNISEITIDGADGHANPRGIWLDGSNATGYSSFYMNVVTIARDAAVPFPSYGINNVHISNCNITMPSRGIYTMNARNTTIENCFVNLTYAGAARCVTINTYSPGTIINACTFVGNGAGIGVLATQYSDVIISNCIFNGSFAGGQDLQLQFGAIVLVQGNIFNTSGTKQILINMGADVIVKDNFFNRTTYVNGARAIDAQCIIPTSEFTARDIALGIGNNSSICGSLVAQNNVIKNQTFIQVDTASNASEDGTRWPAFGQITVKGNIYYGADLYTGSDRAVTLFTRTPATPQTTLVSYTDNQMYPTSAAWQNNVSAASGVSYALTSTQIYFAMFNLVTSGAGAITSSKVAGGDYSLTAAVSGSNIVLTPRSDGGTVPPPLSVVDNGGTVYTYALTRSTNDWILKVYNSAGTQINASTAVVNINVLMGGEGNN